MILHISFKSPTVDNILQAKAPFITFVIMEILTLGPIIFKIPRLVQCSFLFSHPAKELENI